jgi:hypothetical protein
MSVRVPLVPVLLMCPAVETHFVRRHEWVSKVVVVQLPVLAHSSAKRVVS